MQVLDRQKESCIIQTLRKNPEGWGWRGEERMRKKGLDRVRKSGRIRISIQQVSSQDKPITSKHKSNQAQGCDAKTGADVDRQEQVNIGILS
jgi:hypothetical protein